MNDVLEQRLLDQFLPDFRVGEKDCAGKPASFRPELRVPTPVAEDGTIYGQVSVKRSPDPLHPMVEVHFYHLWDRDCGSHGHALDTEHVAALLQGSSDDPATAEWKAVYWYAAAHENTVCDVSQIARSSSLHAESKGATVWISPGKHASYLSEPLCAGGCGADRCELMRPLRPARVINLGEPGRPMNGVLFADAVQWPLAAKMASSNFPPAVLARVDALPSGDIALYNPGRHPAQGIIAISATTGSSIAASGTNTTGALDTASGDTTGALSTAGDKTGNALGRSFRNTRHALGRSTHAVGKAIGVDAGEKTPPAPQ